MLLCFGCTNPVCPSPLGNGVECATCGFVSDVSGSSVDGPTYTGQWEFTHADGEVVSGTWLHRHGDRWSRDTWEWLTYPATNIATGNLIVWLNKSAGKKILAISFLSGKQNGFYASWGADGRHSVGFVDRGSYPLSHIIWDAKGRKTEETIRTDNGITQLGWWSNGYRKFIQLYNMEKLPNGRKQLTLKSHRRWDEAGHEIPELRHGAGSSTIDISK